MGGYGRYRKVQKGRKAQLCSSAAPQVHKGLKSTGMLLPLGMLRPLRSQPMP